MADETTTQVQDLPVGQTRGESIIKNAGAAYLKEIGPERANTPLKEEREGDEPGDDEAEEEELDPSTKTDDDDDDAEGDDAEGEDDGEEDLDAPADKADDTLVSLAGAEGEDPIEVEIEDPAVRERLKSLVAQVGAIDKRSAKVEEREEELDDLHAKMFADPAGFTLENIPKGEQLKVLQVLLLEHFSEIEEQLEAYLTDPGKVKDDKYALRDQRKELQDQVTNRQAGQRAAKQIMRAVHALIPPGTIESEREEFLADAERDLVRVAKAGEKVGPAEVKAILARRLKLYGFDAKAKVVAKPASNGAARPVTDRAKASAEKLAKAKQEQERRKRVQVNRRNAGAIPSGGRGATSVTRPVIKKGSGIKEAGKAILKTGITSWADFRSGK